ncbi:hypothetical protein MRX96_019973 [Rhipicephalus microplus]
MTPMILSDVEETLTDTDKAEAIGASLDPNATSPLIATHNNDHQLGEGIEEDSTACNDVPNMAEEDAYGGVC